MHIDIGLRNIFSHLVLFCLLLTYFPETLIGQRLPIKPARTISLTTREGSYMNLDVSPDGKTLAFDMLGDLYTLPVSGGQAAQITRGLAMHIQPVWAPNGKELACLSDQSGTMQLTIHNLKTKKEYIPARYEKRIRPGERITWLPDNHHIYLADAQTIFGFKGTRRTSVNGETHILRFSSDGHFKYVMDSDWVCVVNLADGDKSRVSRIQAEAPLESYFELSPDRQWMAYYKGSEELSLVVENLADHSVRLLVPSITPKVPFFPPGVNPQRFAFSPDSKIIYIGYGGKIHRIKVASGKDQIIPFVAQVQTDLGAYNYHRFRLTNKPVQIKYLRSIHQRPDGKQLLFTALNKVYVQNLPNGKPRELVDQPGLTQIQPTYSPDGKWVAYVSWCDTLGGQLWRVPSSGGKAEQLTTLPSQYQWPAWSPDGKFIAMVSDSTQRLTQYGEGGTGKLKMLNLAKRQLRTLDDQISMWNNITFSIDGQRIIYQPKGADPYRPEMLSPRLMSRNLEGSDERVIALGHSSTRDDRWFQQRSISPDRKYAVYSMREDLYLVPIVSTQSPPVIFDEHQNITMIRFASGIDPYWDQGGKRLNWTYGNKFFSINPSKIVAGHKRPGLIKININPDKVIIINLKVRASYGRGTIALKNACILTMRGNEVIKRGTVLIKNGRVIGLGSAKLCIPPDAKVYDLSGKTIMPGMIDMHMHLGTRENLNPMQRGANLAELAYGVTTGRDPASCFSSFGEAEMLATGMSIGPRLFTVGAAIFQYSDFKLDDLNDARAIARKRALLGGTYIKQYQLKDRLQKQWMLQACRENGLNMTNEGNDGLFGNTVLDEIAMIKDGSTGVEHSPNWENSYKDVALFFAKTGAFLGETLGVGNGNGHEGDYYFLRRFWNQPNLKQQYFQSDRNGYPGLGYLSQINEKAFNDSSFIENAKINADVIKLGGKVTLGAHGQWPIGVTVHDVLWALQKGGISNMQVLQCATIRGAEALGMQKDLGSIEVGKIADLVILNKNPLDDIHNSREIKYVMKDGILYDGDTLDELWPLYKKCAEWKLKAQH